MEIWIQVGIWDLTLDLDFESPKWDFLKMDLGFENPD